MTEQSLFIAALELTADQRAGLLDSTCADQPELRRRIERLLSLHESAGEFMAQPVVAPGAELPFAEALVSGTRIGPYRLLEQLGEGGMGTVYRAEQVEPVRRIAALKVIRAGLDSRQVIGRFEAERQALALMEHPHIARVLDAGTTESGRPYFVMELVPGVPITRYCDEHRLTLRQRLELFIPVCLAVQHAHQKGIIHRDLKPSNVLVAEVDGVPVAKVIDFGVAKATGPALGERTLQTTIGQLVGTLEYMSPEQARLSEFDIDTRSDVYSLGVMLYELLAGSTPFEKQRLSGLPFMEVLRSIREDEPPTPGQRLATIEELSPIAAARSVDPRKLIAALRGELDWVVMKALEKDRARRYDSASSLARDLERYLHDEPVVAGPPSALYRIGKLARRHRVALSSAVLVLATMLSAIVVSATLAVRATQSERLAQDRLLAERTALAQAEAARQAEALERQAAEAHRAEAEAMRARARRAVDDMYTQVAEKWLVNQPQMQPVQREFLQKALEYYAEFARESGRDPADRLETADAFRRVAEIQHKLGDPAHADEAFRKSIDAFQTLADEIPERPVYRQKLAATLHHLGVLLGDTGRFSEQETVHRRALALQQKLSADNPLDRELRSELGRGYWFLGRMMDSGMSGAAANRALRSAREIQSALVAEFPTVPTYRQQLAQTHRDLSRTISSASNEWKTELHAARSILEKLVADFPAMPGYRNELGDIYYQLALRTAVGDREPLLRKALDLQEQLAAEFPSVTDYRYDLFRTYESLGETTSATGRKRESEQAFHRSIEIGEKLVADSGDVHYYRGRLGTSYMGYATLLSSIGRIPEAENALRKSIAIHTKLLADFPDVSQYPPRLASGWLILGILLAEVDRRAEAREAFEKALSICPTCTQAQHRLARLLVMETEVSPAEIRKAREFAHQVHTVCSQDPEPLITLALAAYRAGEMTEAAQFLREAIALRKQPTPFADDLFAMILWRLNSRDEAQAAFERSAQSASGRVATRDERSIRAEAEQLLNVSSSGSPAKDTQ